MKEHHLFPWWAGYLLISPLRKLTINPKVLLRDYIQPGMELLDAGCAMGFFSIPMAEMTGPEGTVYCVDPQKKMLTVLEKRAAKKGLSGIIETRECAFTSLKVEDLSARIDLALAFAVLHETRDRKAFIAEIASSLRPGGIFIFAEPHVISGDEFAEELAMIENVGFSTLAQFSRGGNTIAITKKA